MELRKQQEEAEKAKEAKEMANKKEKMRLMKEQVTIFTKKYFLIKLLFFNIDFFLCHLCRGRIS
jgi:hypothetical protein